MKKLVRFIIEVEVDVMEINSAGNAKVLADMEEVAAKAGLDIFDQILEEEDL